MSDATAVNEKNHEAEKLDAIFGKCDLSRCDSLTDDEMRLEGWEQDKDQPLQWFKRSEKRKNGWWAYARPELRSVAF